MENTLIFIGGLVLAGMGLRYILSEDFARNRVNSPHFTDFLFKKSKSNSAEKKSVNLTRFILGPILLIVGLLVSYLHYS